MRNLVDKARIGLTGWLKNTDGIEIIRGWGAFQGRDSDRFVLSAGKATLTADKVYLNTGHPRLCAANSGHCRCAAPG